MAQLGHARLGACTFRRISGHDVHASARTSKLRKTRSMAAERCGLRAGVRHNESNHGRKVRCCTRSAPCSPVPLRTCRKVLFARPHHQNLYSVISIAPSTLIYKSSCVFSRGYSGAVEGGMLQAVPRVPQGQTSRCCTSLQLAGSTVQLTANSTALVSRTPDD